MCTVRVCGLFVRAAQPDFEWAVCGSGNVQRWGFPFFSVLSLQSSLWLPLAFAGGSCEWGRVEWGAGGGSSASSCHSKAKFRGYRTSWREGPMCRRQIKSGREVYTGDKTSAFTIEGGQFQEPSSCVSLRAPSFIRVAQPCGVNLWASRGQKCGACAEGTNTGNLNLSWILFLMPHCTSPALPPVRPPGNPECQARCSGPRGWSRGGRRR